MKGTQGLAPFSVCELIQYVRDHSPGGHGSPECPVHPTDLVFALDQSPGVTAQAFARMKEMASAVLRDLRVRTGGCAVGARVAVLTYGGAGTQQLVRFSDALDQSQLLSTLQAIAHEAAASSGGGLGRAMRFISRHVFKRTLPGTHTRRIATFFSAGPADPSDAQELTTAAMELGALDIIPVVIAFGAVPAVRRAFAIDDTGTFQVVVVPPAADYTATLERLQRCTFCYDVCKPDADCDQGSPAPVQSYIDAAFLLDGSRNSASAEFEDLRAFLGALLDHFEITTDPETSVTGDRVALLTHGPPDFLPNTQRSPVRAEFNLTTYSSKRLMKRHVQESVQQLNGEAFVGHALQWTLDKVFLRTPHLRRNKVIFVISAGETSHLDTEVLKEESMRAKCQGYALFVLSLGPAWNGDELEDLASRPLDQHLVQLGRIHKPDHKYGVKFVKSFINSVRRAVNRYPPTNLKARCNRLSSAEPKPLPLRKSPSFVPGPHKPVLKEVVLQKAKFFQNKKYLSRITRGGRDDAIQKSARNTSYNFQVGYKDIQTPPRR